MLILTVILLVMVADKVDAACSMPARKLAGAAIAAASNMRLIVKPLLEVSATMEPVPPEPFWAAWASIDSDGRIGVRGGKIIGGVPKEGLPPLWPAPGKNEEGKKFILTLSPAALRSPSPKGSCGSEMNLNFIA